MTQMLMAKEGVLTPEMNEVLKKEIISREKLLSKIAEGKIIIIPNKRNSNHIALGDGLRSKVLCNVGTSTDSSDFSNVIELAKEAEKYGAALLCDQSSGFNFFLYRQKLLDAIGIPLASVPLYQNAEESLRKYGNPLSFNGRDVIKVFKQQVEQGVSAPGIHPITKALVKKIECSHRIMPYVSRGGTILASWIKNTGNENPYIENFDDLLQICAEENVPISFICTTRSGCLADGFDEVQKFEWSIIGHLIKKAHINNVGAVVDGIGHLRMDKIPEAVQVLKKMTLNVPIGVMGPATTDRSLGYDHISHSIGAAIAIQYGANYCQACCRTEHIGLPERKDVIESIGTYITAVYAADLTKLQHLQEYDDEMSRARSKNQWGRQLELAIEPIKANKTFCRVGPKHPEKKECSICGELCPFKIKDFKMEVKEK